VVETRAGNVTMYTYGHTLIAQTQPVFGTSVYVVDGQLSVRQLANASGAVTDAYDFDAFGVMLGSSGSTPNAYLYAGEQLDPNLGFYYLRARYYQQASGRFISTDPELGNVFEPMSLHRYLYTHSDPVNHRDPSGREEFSLSQLTATQLVVISLGAGFLTFGGTLALGITNDWRVALGYGALATAGTAIALFGGIAIGIEANLARAATSVSSSFLKEFMQNLAAGELAFAQTVLRSYVLRTFLFSAPARCIFIEGLAAAVPGIVIVGIGASSNYNQAITFVQASDRVPLIAAAVQQLRSFGESLGCS